MSPSSKHRHGASPSSPPYRRRRDEEDSFGGEISEEEGDTFTIPPKNVTIEQHKKWRAEGTPLQQFQNKQEGKKKEEYVTRQEEEYVKIQEEGTPMQFQHNNLGSKEEHVTIQGRKEEEHVTTQVEPDAPPMPGVAGIWVNTVLIILLVAEVILGLDFFGVI